MSSFFVIFLKKIKYEAAKRLILMKMLINLNSAHPECKGGRGKYLKINDISFIQQIYTLHIHLDLFLKSWFLK